MFGVIKKLRLLHYISTAWDAECSSLKLMNMYEVWGLEFEALLWLYMGLYRNIYQNYI
jgi:hypothetical protein